MELIKRLQIFKPKIKDFEILSKLGEGAFGEVYKVIKKNKPNKFYALKVLDKKFIHKNAKSHSIFFEKLFLKKMNNSQIVKLYDTFQDEKHVYFLMELVENGDLGEYVKLNGEIKRPDEFKRSQVYPGSTN
jgi:serine/threonine protein kinase